MSLFISVFISVFSSLFIYLYRYFFFLDLWRLFDPLCLFVFFTSTFRYLFL